MDQDIDSFQWLATIDFGKTLNELELLNCQVMTRSIKFKCRLFAYAIKERKVVLAYIIIEYDAELD